MQPQQIPTVIARPGALDEALDALTRVVDRTMQANSPPRKRRPPVEIRETVEIKAKTA
jgi:hypothetical protein